MVNYDDIPFDCDKVLFLKCQEIIEAYENNLLCKVASVTINFKYGNSVTVKAVGDDV